MPSGQDGQGRDGRLDLVGRVVLGTAGWYRLVQAGWGGVGRVGWGRVGQVGGALGMDQEGCMGSFLL